MQTTCCQRRHSIPAHVKRVLREGIRTGRGAVDRQAARVIDRLQLSRAARLEDSARHIDRGAPRVVDGEEVDRQVAAQVLHLELRRRAGPAATRYPKSSFTIEPRMEQFSR